MKSKSIRNVALAGEILKIIGIFTVATLVPAFICQIIVTAAYGKMKKSNDKDFDKSIYILLIVGFFVPIVGIVGLSKASDEIIEVDNSSERLSQIYKLKQLLDDGLITQEEFENKKKTLLI